MKQLSLLCLSLFLLAPVAARADSDPYVDLYTDTTSLLMAHRFDQLDAMADEFRRTNARLPGGDFKLEQFYVIAGSFDSGGCDCIDDKTEVVSFAQKQKVLAAWLAAEPLSPAANIAMAQFLIDKAGVDRTDQFADKVTPEQWRLFEARLAEAEPYLSSLNRKSDPFIYAELTQIARAKPKPRLLLDALYEEAARTFPKFFSLYADRAEMLDMKWYGKDGELATYVNSLLTSPGGDDGEVAYAYAAGRLAAHNRYRPDFLYQEAGLSWPQVQKAFAVRERLYGLSIGDWNTFLFLAVAADDPKSGGGILKHIGKNWSVFYWMTQDGFDTVVRWSEAPGPLPRSPAH